MRECGLFVGRLIKEAAEAIATTRLAPLSEPSGDMGYGLSTF